MYMDSETIYMYSNPYIFYICIFSELVTHISTDKFIYIFWVGVHVQCSCAKLYRAQVVVHVQNTFHCCSCAFLFLTFMHTDYMEFMLM